MANPFDAIEVDFPFSIDFCPRTNDQAWEKCQYKNIDEFESLFPIPLPKLADGNLKALYDFVAGRFRFVRALNTATLARR